ncbi:MAG: UDP-N-acetylmuramate--alanine ligase [Myxococcota bacterium]|jgi:UDP-N-acetylmuramate--alanine ligase
MLTGVKRVHLIGIGGIGVSAVARVLMARGFDVSGSDVRESQITTALREEGATVTIGHDATLVEDTDLVVYSTAIPDTNPELVAARSSDVRLRHRAEVLGALLEPWESVGIIGTHGKGSVSAMITRCLDADSRDPSFIIGGLLNDYGVNARVTGPDGWVVVEIDESDGSLVHVRPKRLIVNNVEADHLNYYKDLEAVYDTIGSVLANEDGRAMAVLHVGDPGVREVVSRLPRPIRSMTCGFDDDLGDYPADVVGSDLSVGSAGSRFTVTFRGKRLGELTMPQPGRYNAMNALVAATAALSAQVPFEAIVRGLGDYQGIENRFTVVDAGPVRVVKDYISHPTGMRRVLAAAKTLQDGPITAIFKPYRFTMIHYLGDEYAVAFKDAEHVVITELYTAGEVPIPGVNAPWLVDKIRNNGTDTAFVEDMEAIPEHLMERLVPGQQIIFFGGDDLFRLADRFIALINAQTDDS